MVVEDNTLIGKLGLTKDQVLQIIDEWNEYFALTPRPINFVKDKRGKVHATNGTPEDEIYGSHYLEFDMGDE